MSTRKFETIEEKLDFLDYRQGLLFDNTESSKLLFECELTRDEGKKLKDLMDSYSERILSGESVSSASFEQAVYSIAPVVNGNYHFCEDIVKNFKEENKWTEVFDALYLKNR